MAESFFKGIAATKAPIGSDYFRAGRYLTYMRKFTKMVSRQEKRLVIFEMTIVAVLDDTPIADPKGPHRKGDRVSWVLDMKKDPSLPNLKAALVAIFGCPESEITEEFCDQLSGEANGIEGMFVEWSNQMIKTQKTGQPFTQVRAKRRWSAAEIEKNIGQQVLDDLGIDTKRADDPE